MENFKLEKVGHKYFVVNPKGEKLCAVSQEEGAFLKSRSAGIKDITLFLLGATRHPEDSLDKAQEFKGLSFDQAYYFAVSKICAEEIENIIGTRMPGFSKEIWEEIKANEQIGNIRFSLSPKSKETEAWKQASAAAEDDSAKEAEITEILAKTDEILAKMPKGKGTESLSETDKLLLKIYSTKLKIAQKKP
jgi:hypothetical protein